ncbi:hypothetical protein [Saccharothrix syringae]|uniref:Uncharacterized protein n=1 Tax=Saccharothrix syringae TaxID=103733 RepID=A0A5Q0GXU8_SACSY|nr:hypothetical protein [Saccharothrix syringae]QFZ18515.1 hypothetical protein EKG83_14470 [Saccharothrix syringae]
MTTLLDLLLGKYFWRLYLTVTTLLVAVIALAVAAGSHAPLWIGAAAGWTALPSARRRWSRIGRSTRSQRRPSPDQS